jgi:acyl-coenzyme A synthetase/AMP-(fatty) acid ligase
VEQPDRGLDQPLDEPSICPDVFVQPQTLPDFVGLEEVAAVVVLREAATEAELLVYCREHLADYKRPKQIHITQTIPRTATGKIQRGVVAKTYAAKA